MRQMAFVGVLAVTLVPSFSRAETPDMFPQDPIGDLGMIIASEEMCGLKLSTEAVDAYVQRYLKEDGGMAAQRVLGAVSASKLMLGQPTGSMLTAHCAAITKVANHLALTEGSAQATGN